MAFRTVASRRRTLIALQGATLAALAGPGPLSAQASSTPGYPNRPVRIVVPWPVGGITDVSARLLAQRLSTRLGSPVIVDNKPGANGRIGAESVANATPDGYTLFLATVETHAINPYVFSSTRYQPQRDFVAIAPFAINPFTFTARSELGLSSMKEVVARAKASPGKLTSASWGIGSTSQLILEMVKAQAGVDILHVPFQGEAPAVTALLGNQIDFMVMPAARADQLKRDGRVRVMAVTTGRRIQLLADTPTLKEEGYDVDVANWFGIVAPAKTPAAIVERLDAEIRGLLGEADFAKALLDIGVEPHPPVTASEFGRFVESEGRRWGGVIQAANIRLD